MKNVKLVLDKGNYGIVQFLIQFIFIYCRGQQIQIISACIVWMFGCVSLSSLISNQLFFLSQCIKKYWVMFIICTFIIDAVHICNGMRVETREDHIKIHVLN